MPKPRATRNNHTASGVNDAKAASQNSVESVGGRLRDAREAQKITEKAAAQKLHLMVTDLRAIEADHYAASTNDDLLRSHLRNYAKLLRLNPDSILAIYDRQMGTFLQRGINRIDDIPRANLHSFGSLFTGALMLITLVLGSVVLLQFTKASRLGSLLAENRDDQEVGSQQVNDSAVTDAKVEAADLSQITVAGETTADVKELVLAAAEIKPDPPDAAQAQTMPAVSSADQAVDSALTEVAATYQSASDAGVGANMAATQATDKLSFRFAKDCWVEVYDVDGQRLIAEIRQAGGSLQLSGKSPFKVLVGHSREVVLQFNDHPIAIEKIDRSYSTLFTVGRTGSDPEAPMVKTIRRKLP